MSGVFAARTALPAREAGICQSEEISSALHWSIFTIAVRFGSDSPIRSTVPQAAPVA